jgi:UDP-N-acetylmuramoyl-tripeptide--D-alanyl-D-alanine ligase
MAVVVSPASFNNRMGLARAINEHLAPGTEVFVAEMGTYGKGEIADLCAFIPPEVAVITAIGPVHLERFGSEEQIAEAKREILADAKVAVICIDHPLLEKLASAETRRRKVVRVSAFDESADVAVIDGAVTIQGRVIGNVGADVFRSNLACAIAVALHFEVPIEDIERRLVLLPGTSHRREVRQSERGFAIVDDTYNSNPAGARLAVEALGSLSEGRRVVVTPGMVELGPVQFDENRKLAAEIGAVATDLVVVGVTNRRALLEGSKDGSVAVTVVGSRDEAADWVRSTLGPGDAVLYENDLPDHYP